MTEPKQHETPQEWAKRAIAEHGPMPQRLVDHVNRLRLKYVVSEPATGKRTA